MKRPRRDSGVSQLTPLGSSRSPSTPSTPLSSSRSSRSCSISRATEECRVQECNLPKYEIHGKENEKKIQQEVPAFEMRKQGTHNAQVAEMRKGTLSDMRLVLEMVQNWNIAEGQGIHEVEKRGRNSNWMADTEYIWKDEAMVDFVKGQSVPGCITRVSQSGNNQFGLVPPFIACFLRGSYEDFKRELEAAMNESCGMKSKNKCWTCAQMRLFNHLETIFTQPVEKVKKFFDLVPKDHSVTFRHFRSLMDASLLGRTSPMINSLISTGFGEQALIVLDFIRENGSKKGSIDAYCFAIKGDKKRENVKESMLTQLIESGEKEEIIMNFEKRSLFNALDVEEAELKAIEMNSMAAIRIVQKVKKQMYREMKLLDAARQRNAPSIKHKWDCRLHKLCPAFIFECRKNVNKETRLHIAAEFADGEVLKWVLNVERKRVVDGKHPDIDKPDVYLYTPLMNTISVGNLDLMEVFANEFGASMLAHGDESVWTVAVEKERFNWMNRLASLPLHHKDFKSMHIGFPLARCVRKGRSDQIPSLLRIYKEKHWIQDGNVISKDHLDAALFAAMMEKDMTTSMALVRVGAVMETAIYPFDHVKKQWKDGVKKIEIEIDKVEELKRKR